MRSCRVRCGFAWVHDPYDVAGASWSAGWTAGEGRCCRNATVTEAACCWVLAAMDLGACLAALVAALLDRVDIVSRRVCGTTSSASREIQAVSCPIMVVCAGESRAGRLLLCGSSW